MSKEADKKNEVETDVSKLKGWKKIQNQQIRHILITPTFRCAMLCYFIFAVILGGFGALLFLQASSLNDMLIRYDDQCNGTSLCTVSFTPIVTLTNPKLYYKLENFYANHRNFVKSRNFQQLRGIWLDSDKLTSCSPVQTMQQLSSPILKKAVDGTVLKSTDPAYPCGLIAKYYFTDTFSMFDSSTNAVPISEKGIAHSVDINNKFLLTDTNPLSRTWLDVTNEHVMVWFQMESFSNFIKLWGHVGAVLTVGQTYSIQISNTFDVSQFDGKKYIYLSEVNSFGGTNKFLGIAFLAIAGVVVFIMLIFIILYFARIAGKDLYSTENLKW